MTTLDLPDWILNHSLARNRIEIKFLVVNSPLFFIFNVHYSCAFTEQIAFRYHFEIQIGSTDWFIKICTIQSSNTLLSLVRFFMNQSLNPRCYLDVGAKMILDVFSWPLTLGIMMTWDLSSFNLNHSCAVECPRMWQITKVSKMSKFYTNIFSKATTSN